MNGYEKVRYGQDDATISAREACMERISMVGKSAPSTAWVDRLRERQEAGEILTVVQLEMIRRASL